MMVKHSIVVMYIVADRMCQDKTFDEIVDEIDANIKRIKAEIKREEDAFTESI